MRVVSAQESYVQALPYQRFGLRVWVKDSGGTYQDLTNLGGINWVDEVEYGQDVDQPVSDAVVRLRRDSYQLTLAPLVGASKFNQGATQVDVGRGIKIETATVPCDPYYAIQAADWNNVFEGYIDELDAGGDGPEGNFLVLQCRDLGAALQERWLEAQGRPGPLPNNPYGTPGGTAVETIAQQVADDWGPGGITVYTPAGTDGTPINIGDVAGWNITKWTPDVQNVLDALRVLANQIGYEVRYRWGTPSSPAKWRLEFFNPPRSKSVPDGTITAAQWFSAKKVGISRANVRNVVVVSYQTDSYDPSTRQAYSTNDPTSVGKYGRRWMQITEDASSAINTVTEATKMATAILADLKDPKVDQEVETQYLYHLELGDLLTFKANGVHYDTDQNFAVVGLKHRLTTDQARTTIVTRGTPAGSYMQWGRLQGTGDGPPPSNTFGGDVLAVGPNVTGVAGGVDVTPPNTKLDEDLLHYEVHVSTSPVFVPTSASLKTKMLGTRVQALGLPMDQPHFVKLVPVRKSGVKGVASPAASAIPGKVTTDLLADQAVIGAKLAAATIPAQAFNQQGVQSDALHSGMWAGLIGNGSDGDVQIDGITSYPAWSTKSGFIYTLTRDVSFTNLIMSGSGGFPEIRSNGFRISVRDLFAVFALSLISANGGDGTTRNSGGAFGSYGAVGGGAGTLGCGGRGGEGGLQAPANGSGGNGVASSRNYGIAGGGGSLGGDGGTGNGAGVIGTGSGAGAVNSNFGSIENLMNGYALLDTRFGAVNGGVGGGGGGGGKASTVAVGGAGGGGGGGGGVIGIYCGSFYVDPGNYLTVQARGGSGGGGAVGGDANAGKGGGGGGGGGGVIVFMSKKVLVPSGGVRIDTTTSPTQLNLLNLWVGGGSRGGIIGGTGNPGGSGVDGLPGRVIYVDLSSSLATVQQATAAVEVLNPQRFQRSSYKKTMIGIAGPTKWI